MRIDPNYMAYLHTHRPLRVVHALSNFFSFRVIVLMFSRWRRGPHWDARWVNRGIIIRQLISLMFISLTYNLILLGLIATYIFYTERASTPLFYYEVLAFASLMVLLDTYHIIFMRSEEEDSFRESTLDKTADLE
jgi:hypothetical protein